MDRLLVWKFNLAMFFATTNIIFIIKSINISSLHIYIICMYGHIYHQLFFQCLILTKLPNLITVYSNKIKILWCVCVSHREYHCCSFPSTTTVQVVVCTWHASLPAVGTSGAGSVRLSGTDNARPLTGLDDHAHSYSFVVFLYNYNIAHN